MKLDDAVYKYYLCDLVTLLKEEMYKTENKLKNLQSKLLKSKNDIIFQDGRLLAYQEVLTTMINQAKLAFQIPLKDINLHDVDTPLLIDNAGKNGDDLIK